MPNVLAGKMPASFAESPKVTGDVVVSASVIAAKPQNGLWALQTRLLLPPRRRTTGLASCRWHHGSLDCFSWALQPAIMRVEAQMDELDEYEELESQIRAVFRAVSPCKLTDGDIDVFLDRQSIREVLETDEFLEYLDYWRFEDRYLPPMDRTAGGGKNDKHANKDPNLAMPGKLKGVEDDLRRLLGQPPLKDRQKEIKKLKDKKKHIQRKGGFSGDPHAIKDKGYQTPGIREEEDKAGDDDAGRQLE